MTFKEKHNSPFQFFAPGSRQLLPSPCLKNALRGSELEFWGNFCRSPSRGAHGRAPPRAWLPDLSCPELMPEPGWPEKWECSLPGRNKEKSRNQVWELFLEPAWSSRGHQTLPEDRDH